MSVILNLASTTLNRDVTKVNQELYSSSTGTKVDVTLDNRLLSQTGQTEIVDDVKTALIIINAINQIDRSQDIIKNEIMKNVKEKE